MAHITIFFAASTAAITPTTRGTLEGRLAEHNAGLFEGYTSTRRPVLLVYGEWFERVTDAIAAERQVKGWSRAKKEALIRGEFNSLPGLSRRHGPYPSRRPSGSSG